VPVVEANPWTYFLFLAIIVSVGLGLMNLILAVIVDRAHESRQEDLESLTKLKQRDEAIALKRLKKICKALAPENESLTLQHVLDGFEEVHEFRDQLKSMDINRDDLALVFHILDADGSGDVDHVEFVEQLHKFKTQDTHTLLCFIQHYVLGVLEGVQDLKRCHGLMVSEIPARKSFANKVPGAGQIGGASNLTSDNHRFSLGSNMSAYSESPSTNGNHSRDSSSKHHGRSRRMSVEEKLPSMPKKTVAGANNVPLPVELNSRGMNSRGMRAADFDEDVARLEQACDGFHQTVQQSALLCAEDRNELLNSLEELRSRPPQPELHTESPEREVPERGGRTSGRTSEREVPEREVPKSPLKESKETKEMKAALQVSCREGRGRVTFEGGEESIHLAEVSGFEVESMGTKHTSVRWQAGSRRRCV